MRYLLIAPAMLILIMAAAFSVKDTQDRYGKLMVKIQSR